ncbi:MAG: hypothetical protein A2Z29_08510 [Chloroflexi bacterium RBG_16_56_11]|nr:MAG: hypothetical protein A2Z29_08510 [Chloroflexi bacterium RBG_16_56_11]
MTDNGSKQKKCIHYWILESPDGRTSVGKCKYCGVSNEFSNDWHDALNNLGKKESPSREPDLETESEPVETVLVTDV